MNILQLIDEVRIIAMNGLEYAGDEHDRRRYERLLELVAGCYGEVLEMPAPAVRERLAAELGHVTPKVGTEGAIIDREGRILLTRRADGRWGLPCGWVEPDESPYQAVVREVREETGLSVRRYWSSSPGRWMRFRHGMGTTRIWPGSHWPRTLGLDERGAYADVEGCMGCARLASHCGRSGDLAGGAVCA